MAKLIEIIGLFPGRVFYPRPASVREQVGVNILRQSAPCCRRAYRFRQIRHGEFRLPAGAKDMNSRVIEQMRSPGPFVIFLILRDGKTCANGFPRSVRRPAVATAPCRRAGRQLHAVTTLAIDRG